MEGSPGIWILKPKSILAKCTPLARIADPLEGRIDVGQSGHDPLEIKGRELTITGPLQRRAVQLVEVASLGSGHRQALGSQP